jgi:nucleotide-binding universal stress UspA family protein
MYRKILVPLDGSELSEKVLPHIEHLAEGGAEVILFRVCEPPVVLADYPADLQTSWEDHVRQETAHIREQCRVYLGDIRGKLEKKGLKVTAASGTGRADEEIVKFAEQAGVDVIVMASHGRSGLARWAYGSTADRVLKSSPIPVLLIKSRE